VTSLLRVPGLVVLLLTAVVVGYVGCARKGPLSHDLSIATRQINQLLPAGTSEARARKALTDRGFHLSRLNAEAGPNYLLVATYSQEQEVWQVGVVMVAGKVAATSVTVPDGK
jgi:hypothetical protein